jgi:hypothetical protein
MVPLEESARSVHWVSHIEPLLEGAAEHVIANGAFVYKHTVLGASDHLSAWLLRFYGQVEFIGLTTFGEAQEAPFLGL